jgi:hypothetical protein
MNEFCDGHRARICTVTQNTSVKQLGVLDTVGLGEQGQPAEHAQHAQVRESQCHEH